MTEMTLAEALEILGVDENATPEEVNKAYHKLSKNTHPDVSETHSSDEQARLNRAYETITTSIQLRTKGDLTPTEVKQAVEILEREVVRQTASREGDAFVKRVINTHIQPLQMMKYISFLSAALAALFGWLGNDAGLYFNIGETLQASMKSIAVIFGITGGMTHFLVQHHIHRIEQFQDRLSDEDYCARVLRESGVETEKSFTRSDLWKEGTSGDTHLQRPLAVILTLSKRERVELALLKGLEIGIIEQVKNSRRRYRVANDAGYLFC